MKKIHFSIKSNNQLDLNLENDLGYVLIDKIEEEYKSNVKTKVRMLILQGLFKSRLEHLLEYAFEDVVEKELQKEIKQVSQNNIEVISEKIREQF